MENKNTYMLIGQICGLRKAVAEVENRVEFLKSHIGKMKESAYEDDYVYGEESTASYALREAEKNLLLVGEKYAKFKCWFKHNHNEFFHQELKKAIKIVELEIIGDSEANLDKLISHLDGMANEVLIDWEQLKLTDNFQKAQGQKGVEVSMSYFEKNFKADFMKTHKAKIDGLNVYLEKHQQKKILKDKMPRKAVEVCDYFLNLKKILESNKGKLLALKA